MDPYQEGFKAGYEAARRFYGTGARGRLDRIATATGELLAVVAEAGGRPPALLLRYLDEVLTNATAEQSANTHIQR